MLKYLKVPQEIAEPDLFKQMVKLSLITHVGLFLILGLKATLFPKESLNLEGAIRVDMVGLPDKIAHLPEPTAKTPETQAKPEPEKTKAAPVVLSPKNKTLAKIRKMEREEREQKVLEKIQQEVAAEETKAKINQLIKGNTISPGTALHGLAKSEFNEYLGQLHNHVREHWNLPEWLQNDTLKAAVVVYVDYRGVVLKRVLEKSSGDARFDNYALKAVDESSPFPRPPAKFVDLVRVDGIVLGFPQ